MIIIKGGSRCNGAFFAKHLMNPEHNAQVHVEEIRGFAAKNIGHAFYEMKAVASGTRCKNFFYHANINPEPDETLTAEQWERAVDALEKELGLEGQARFVVEHEKKGRVHRHVVWSRIDVDQMRAIRMDKDYSKHQVVSRQLEKEFGLKQGRSVLGPDADKENRPERRPESWETFRGQKSGIDVKDLKEEVTRLWKGAENGEALKAALQSHGYILARGDRRTYCIVDRNGDVHSLAKRITGAKVKDIEKKLSDLDPKTLPHVKEAAAYQRELAEKEAKGKAQQQEDVAKDEEQQRQRTAEQEEARREQSVKEEEDRRQQAAQNEEQLRQAGLEAETKRQEEFRKQCERQTEQAREMAAQQERLEQYKAAMASYAEQARREAENQRRREELDARIRERDIRNAKDRYGEAIGQHYSIRDPYESLARAAMAEYGAFIRERGKLDAQIAKAENPLERRRLELRKEIEAADYMAITSERIAAQSEVIVGHDKSPEAIKQKERAKGFQEKAETLRQEYREIVVEQNRGKEKAEPVNEQDTGKEFQQRGATNSPQTERQNNKKEQVKPQGHASHEQGEKAAKADRRGSGGPSIFVEERGQGHKGPEQRLSDYIRTLPEKPPRREFTKEELRNNPEAMKARLLQQKDDQNRGYALDNIARNLKSGKNLNMKDIRRLSREDIEEIKRRGDQYLKAIVQQHEKERDRGLER